MVKQAIIFFLRYPDLGDVKTRLAKEVGEGFTLKLYRGFIDDTLRTIESLETDAFLFVTPAARIPNMAGEIKNRYPVFGQTGEDLGERMNRSFQQVFSMGYGQVILVGADIPDLPAQVFSEGFVRLDQSDAVLGPAADGGYYMIGFNKDTYLSDCFFDIAWSSEHVLKQSLECLSGHGRTVSILDIRHDIDNLSDLKSFYKRNKNSAFKDCETMRLLKGNPNLSSPW